MKNLFSVLMVLLLLVSCGKDGLNGKVHHPTTPVGKNDKDNYVPVARAIIKVSGQESYAYQKLLKAINPINSAYAAANANTTVTYTASEVGQLNLDVTALVPVDNDDTLDLGSITVSTLKVNKLKVCGPGNNQKCGTAVIRVYTQELIGFEGIEGFVNTTDSYGVPVLAGKGTASETVGLGSAQAAIVQSYTIPANDRKINLTDFPSPTYLIESDFSNAGAGDYEMTIIVELALAL